jgi:hypothetical protein
MTRMSRKRRVAIAVGSVFGLGLLTVAGGWAWSKRPRELPPLETVLPEFEEPNASVPRAPIHVAFGVEIGAIQVEDLMPTLRERGLECDDTSVRAAVEKLREYKRTQLAEADDPDAVSGASILYKRSKKETNPQVRLACDDANLSVLEPGRPSVEGRALFIFDSPEHPLRHVSIRRTYTQSEAAMLDLREAVARYERDYGEPHSRRGEIPAVGSAPAKPGPVRLEWRYADLFVEISSNSFGKMISIDERVEVPWPIRADAPTL